MFHSTGKGFPAFYKKKKIFILLLHIKFGSICFKNMLLAKIRLGSWLTYYWRIWSPCVAHDWKQMAAGRWPHASITEVVCLDFLNVLLLWSLRGHHLPSFTVSLEEQRRFGTLTRKWWLWRYAQGLRGVSRSGQNPQDSCPLPFWLTHSVLQWKQLSSASRSLEI